MSQRRRRSAPRPEAARRDAEAPVDPERRWWLPALLCGMAAALPFLLYRYLPLMDLPVHQLAFAAWAEGDDPGKQFGTYYERASYGLPYWTTFLLARPFLFLGAEAASRVPVALYAAALPLAAGLLARAAGRSGFWGLLLVPFVLEFNLAHGFVSYCLGGVLVCLVAALALRAETAERPGRLLAGQAALALVLGWTHPQAAAAGAGLVALWAALRTGVALARRAAIAGAALPALLPAAAHFATGDQAAVAFGGAPRFEPIGRLATLLPQFSVDVFPGALDGLLAIAALTLAGGAWLAQPRRRPTLAELRPAIAAGLFLVAYFVTPFEWRGQAIGQRMPYLALLLLPAVAPPRRAPGRALKAALVALALIGLGQTAVAVRGFDRDTAAALDPLAERTPAGSRLMYFAYDLGSPWVNAQVYTHAGAWITLRRGGVYGFNFERLNVRWRPNVPREQTLVGKEFLLARRLRGAGRPPTLVREDFAFFDTFLVRFPDERAAFAPMPVPREAIADAARQGAWGLLRLKP